MKCNDPTMIFPGTGNWLLSETALPVIFFEAPPPQALPYLSSCRWPPHFICPRKTKSLWVRFSQYTHFICKCFFFLHFPHLTQSRDTSRYCNLHDPWAKTYPWALSPNCKEHQAAVQRECSMGPTWLPSSWGRALWATYIHAFPDRRSGSCTGAKKRKIRGDRWGKKWPEQSLAWVGNGKQGVHIAIAVKCVDSDEQRLGGRCLHPPARQHPVLGARNRREGRTAARSGLRSPTASASEDRAELIQDPVPIDKRKWVRVLGHVVFTFGDSICKSTVWGNHRGGW